MILSSRLRWVFTTAVIATAPLVVAQTSEQQRPEAAAAAAAAPEPTVGGTGLVATDHTPARRVPLGLRNAAVVAGVALGVAAYGKSKWWQDGFTGRFRAESEGWFGRNTDYGGADKLGHVMFTYAGTRLGARVFEAIGNDRRSALRLGLWTALGTLTAVEITDGFSKRWRFSYEDVLTNIGGVALAWWLETDPAADAWLDFRVHYRRSTVDGERRDFDPFGDYSGQTYVLAVKAAGSPRLRHNPFWRYVEFVVGYNARGFDASPATRDARSRHLYVGVALNLSEVLRQTAFRGNVTRSRTQAVTETFLEYVQLPGTALVTDHGF